MHNYQSRGQDGQGLVCRVCGGRLFTVIYTRNRNGYVVRSRQCKRCGQRMITWERPAGSSS
jgi:transcriptional regulator NrdR family protein